MAGADSERRTLAAIAKRIQVKGLAVVDGRMHSARVVKRWQRLLTNDLGGPGSLTTAQTTLIELATRTRLVLEHVDAYLLTKKSLLNKRHGKLLPVVMDRMRISDTLTRQLLALGLERKTKVLPALASYVDQTYTPSSPSPSA